MAIRMRPTAMIAPTFLLILCSWLTCPVAFAASATSTLLTARQEAESKGYAFFTNRDEIASRAKKEGKLRVMTGLDDSAKLTAEAFRKRYPFIDLHVESVVGSEAAQRAFLEIKAGAAKDWDIMRLPTGLYSESVPHLWKVDLLGMAEHGVLDVPLKMVDLRNRNLIALVSRVAVVAYNKNLVPPSQVPKSWEDMLKPEWKGRKFAADIRPGEIASLVPVWGLEKTLEYSRKIAAQQPIWSRGTARVLTAVGGGEIPLYLFGPTFDSVTQAQRKDSLGAIEFTVLEPVPIRLATEQAILSTSRNPHAALLWLEFMAGTEAQKLIDQHEPLMASLYSKGSAAEQMLRGKKVSVITYGEVEQLDQWIPKIIEAYGFPKVESK